MNNSIIYFIGLLTVTTILSWMVVTSQEDSNATSSSIDLNDYFVNNTTLINDSLNSTITSDTNSSNVRLSSSAVVTNATNNTTNKTAFMIGNGLDDNESIRKIGGSIKPMANPSKMWYLIQGVPHGYV